MSTSPIVVLLPLSLLLGGCASLDRQSAPEPTMPAATSAPAEARAAAADGDQAPDAAADSVPGSVPGQAAANSAPDPRNIAALQPVDSARRTADIVAQPSAYARDRAAILAMLGEYAVSFDFQETVPLSSGYARHKAKTTGAFEAVVLVEDSGPRISLQHLLVVGDQVIKHWRQDWEYQAATRWEFSADQTWRVRPLPAEQTRGAWTQCVYEVSDAPRYCGTGRWRHEYGAPTWTSDRSWRPLPRREYTQRQDYNALNVENRHTITPGGWTHEQDNTKVLREGERTAHTLVREFGFNDYRRIDGFDFSPAYAYWQRTADYWAAVRSGWQRRIAQGDGIALNTPVDGMPIIAAFFAQAASFQGDQAPPQADIDAIFARYTQAPGTPAAAAPAPPNGSTPVAQAHEG